METIEFKNVSFSYPECEDMALSEVSFAVHKSEFIVVCGTSGSGKTTLLRHIKKNMMPFGQGKGKILYEGEEIENLDDRVNALEIGYVMQSPENQIVTDTVWHELAFGMESLGCSNEVIRRRTAEMAEYFGIGGWFRKNVWELSGGQKQIMNLAAVMAMQPKILILDEPTAQLDPIAASHFLSTLKKINMDFGTTIILSEHRLEEAFPLADRVMVMEGGKLLAFDTPSKFGRIFQKNKDTKIFHILPASMRIFAGINEYVESSINQGKTETMLQNEQDSRQNRGQHSEQESRQDSEEQWPVTVRDARLWLDNTVDKVVTKKIGYVKKGAGYKANEISDKKNEEPVIYVKDLCFRYEKKEKDILHNVNFSLYRGELLALMGGNGAGKTTLLKLLSKIQKPYAGKLNTSAKIAALPQNPQAIFTEITVEEELAEVFSSGPNNGYCTEEIVEKVNQMLTRMGLHQYRKRNPYDLSGGQQQKLAIGKVLLTGPEVLLLDEPTKGIDPLFKKSLGKLFTDLCSQGTSIIMVSHDIDFCAEYAQRCALIFDGTIITESYTREFFSGNSFYTTSANRISSDIWQNCITSEDVIMQFQTLFQSGLEESLVKTGGKDATKL